MKAINSEHLHYHGGQRLKELPLRGCRIFIHGNTERSTEHSLCNIHYNAIWRSQWLSGPYFIVVLHTDTYVLLKVYNILKSCIFSIVFVKTLQRQNRRFSVLIFQNWLILWKEYWKKKYSLNHWCWFLRCLRILWSSGGPGINKYYVNFKENTEMLHISVRSFAFASYNWTE